MLAGHFTGSDLATISRAANLAELLTQRYFDFGESEWKRNPYSVLTRRQVSRTLHEDTAFASVVRLRDGHGPRRRGTGPDRYAVVLQDPVILSALLRSLNHDLWTLGLFILTHELVHIVRFRRFDVDFFASEEERDREETLVHAVTAEILSGVTNATQILSLYQDPQAQSIAES